MPGPSTCLLSSRSWPRRRSTRLHSFAEGPLRDMRAHCAHQQGPSPLTSLLHFDFSRPRSDAHSANCVCSRALQRSQHRRHSTPQCSAKDGNSVHLQVSEPYRGPNSPVSGFRLWLPGGGLVHVQANVDPTAVIEAAAVVQEGASIGRKCHVGSGSIIGRGVTVGEKTRLESQVVLQHCSVGCRCLLESGVKIGGRGFVFRIGPDGALEQPKEHQTFRAEVRDNVEIGANTVVDRGSWRDTVIDKGARLDCLVHIGHDSTTGRACILCSGASVGASSSLGDDVVLGHGAAVRDHVTVAPGSRVAAKSGVVRDITEPGDYAGHPAVPAADFKQQVAVSRAHWPPRESSGVDSPGQREETSGTAA